MGTLVPQAAAAAPARWMAEFVRVASMGLQPFAPEHWLQGKMARRPRSELRTEDGFGGKAIPSTRRPLEEPRSRQTGLGEQGVNRIYTRCQNPLCARIANHSHCRETGGREEGGPTKAGSKRVGQRKTDPEMKGFQVPPTVPRRDS